jgi:hypothetical protein
MFNYIGQTELASKLNISKAENISIPGSCNSRIIRTTLQDSYNNEPSLYIIGLTFLTRYELPIRLGEDPNEGKWVSITGNGTANFKNFDTHIDNDFITNYSDLWNRSTLLSLPDLAVDLQFKLISAIESLISRGHQILVFNTAENIYQYFLDESKFNLLRQTTNIVQGLQWRAVPWQFEQGATYLPEDEQYPADCRHVAPGGHRWLNDFLTNYIHEHKIIQ